MTVAPDKEQNRARFGLAAPPEMGTSLPVPRAYRFGVFVADIPAGELHKNGITIKLGQQPFQILTLLLEHAGQVVSREQLRQTLWPADTFVDFDHNMNSAVNKLREALNDSAEHPRYIETLPRRGYRFLLPVESVATETQVPGAPGRRTWLVASLGIILGASVIGGVLATNSGGLREWLFGVSDPPIKRLAVLPLENLTGDPAQDYLANGMHEALITELAKISSVEVVSRTSVMRYKKTGKSVPEIAKELRVDAVVEGALLASGKRVRVTAQLIAAQPERHLWAENVDRDTQDILVLYSDVARAILGSIQAKLTPQEQTQLASSRKVDPAVYKLELRGRFYLHKGGIETDRTEATDFFEKAIQLDPTYAPAYQGLATAYWGLGLRSSLPPREAYAKAKGAALKAVELDDSLSQAHHVLGQISYLYEWDWEGAEREFQRVRQLDSSWAGPILFLCLTGRFDEAIAASRRNLEFDPQSETASHNLGFIYFWARRYDEAIAQQKRTLELDPDRPYSRSQIGWAYAKRGMYSEAVAECDEAIRQLGEREDQELIGHCGWVYAVSGRRDKALDVARRLRLSAPPGWVNPVLLAKIYDGLGDRRRAVRFLNQAFEEHSPLMAHLKTDPMYSDNLRADPRFQELIRRVGPP